MSELNESCIKLLSTTTISDLTATEAAYTLYTVPDGKTLIISEVWLKASAVVSALRFTIGRSTALTDFTIGTTASTGIVVPTSLAAANDVIIIKPLLLTAGAPCKQKAYPEATIIQVNITTKNGTAASGTFYLFGFLF